MDTEERKKVVIENAYNNIPYYHNYFKNMPNSLEDFPYSSKELLIENEKILLSTGTDVSELKVNYTSGTTGVPLKIYKSRKEIMEISKILWKWRASILGYENIDKMLNLTFQISSMDHPNDNHSGIFETMNCSYISIEDLREKTPDQLYDFIQKEKPVWIMSTASLLIDLLDRISKSERWFDGCLESVKYVEFMSEKVFDSQKEKIMRMLNCKTYSTYGMQEIWPIAGECKCGELHIFEDLVFCENTPENEIVVTSLCQKTFPIIRYKTNDFGTISKKKCKCGKKATIITGLQGRKPQNCTVGDVTLSNKVFWLAVESIELKGLGKVEKYKVEQIDDNEFQVFIKGQIQEEAKECLRSYLTESFKQKLNIEVIVVDEMLNSKVKWNVFETYRDKIYVKN